MKTDLVLWFKGICAFGLPFLTTLGASLAVAPMTAAGWIGAAVAGMSGLNSFLSTSFADAKAQVAQDVVNAAAGLPPGIPPAAPAPSPSTAPQPGATVAGS